MSNFELIDTHCHLTDLTTAELESQLSAAATCAVRKVICIGACKGKESSFRAVEIARQYPCVFATVGIHPHDAKDFTALDELEQLCCDANDNGLLGYNYSRRPSKIVAIGETGLDYFREWAPFEAQKELFANTIAFALNLNKPLVIHCRDAAEDTLAMLRSSHAERIGGVFHCYAQDSEYAKKLADLNFLVSFTGNITFKKAEALRQVVHSIPIDQIMLETDSPYMAPEPFRGTPSEPKHVLQIAQKIAELKSIPITEIAEQTTANAKRLFKLP